MTVITNHTKGPRIFNVKVKGTEDQVEQVVVGPGQTSPDVDLIDPEDRVLVGMHEAGEISLDGKRAATYQDRDAISEARVEHEKQLYELRLKERDLEEREAELRAQQDIVQKMYREAATQAGQLLADPLPPGTDTKGGKESEEALRRAGVDPKAQGQQGQQGQGARPAGPAQVRTEPRGEPRGEPHESRQAPKK
jgi:hypothetical protein